MSWGLGTPKNMCPNWMSPILGRMDGLDLSVNTAGESFQTTGVRPGIPRRFRRALPCATYLSGANDRLIAVVSGWFVTGHQYIGLSLCVAEMEKTSAKG